MNVLLIAVGLVLLYNIVDCYKKGMVRAIISFITLIILCITVALLGNGIQSYLEGEILNVIVMALFLGIVGLVNHLLNVVFFPAKLITKLPIVKSVDKMLGIVVGILETILLLWTMYTFMKILDMGEIGLWLLRYTKEAPVLHWFYENNYLSYWVQCLGAEIRNLL